MKFHKMRDQTPAIAIAAEFSKRFEKACEKEFGEILPSDRNLLMRVAGRIIREMGAPAERLEVFSHGYMQNEQEKKLALER